MSVTWVSAVGEVGRDDVTVILTMSEHAAKVIGLAVERQDLDEYDVFVTVPGETGRYPARIKALGSLPEREG